MKLKNGKNWYIQDLSNYTDSFLIEILLELNEELREKRRVKMPEKVNFVDEEGKLK